MMIFAALFGVMFALLGVTFALFGVTFALDACSQGVYNNAVLHNGVCIVCPRGFYGTNCTHLCPPGSYGSECLEKCDCSGDEFCHPSDGCGSLTEKGLPIPRDKRDLKEIVNQESCTEVLTQSVAVSCGVLLLLVSLYVTCIHQGRANIRVRLKKWFENYTARSRYQEHAQQPNRAETTESSINQESYAEMDIFNERPGNSYYDLCVMPTTVGQDPASRSDYVSMKLRTLEAKAANKADGIENQIYEVPNNA